MKGKIIIKGKIVKEDKFIFINTLPLYILLI